MLYMFLLDHEKVFIIEKDDSSGYGIHIIDSRPAVITEVDEGSPGARAGVREGQIVISINNVNVLEHDHDDIIKLVQESKLTCTIPYSFNPLYSSRLFYCYMLDESIRHFRGVRSILSMMKNPQC